MIPLRITITASDGCPFVARLYESQLPLRGTVIIAGALATPQKVYSEFANYLATQGFQTWTFDYRGTGESIQYTLRACDADISDWIEYDFDALVCYARSSASHLPLFIVGHSLGGQIVPLLPSAGQVDGLVNIAVGSGSVAHNQPAIRRRSHLLWYVLVPLLVPLFGYFPGKKLGVFGDIPRRVIYQWRRWCLTPEYILTGHKGARLAYAKATYPVLALSMSDDELLMDQGSRLLHDAYLATSVDYRVISPEHMGVKRIGHSGFFKSVNKALWPLIFHWLLKRKLSPSIATTTH